MKITTKQLRKIIKEELATRKLNEGISTGPAAVPLQFALSMCMFGESAIRQLSEMIDIFEKYQNSDYLADELADFMNNNDRHLMQDIYYSVKSISNVNSNPGTKYILSILRQVLEETTGI